MDFRFWILDFRWGIGHWALGVLLAVAGRLAREELLFSLIPQSPVPSPQLTTSLDDAQEDQNSRAKGANAKH